MMPPLLGIALGTLVSEDLTLISTGALVAQHRLGFVEGTLACVAGIFGGDLLLYLAGRLAGRPALRWGPLAQLVSPERVEHASMWLERRGAIVVLLSRFTPGLRLPTYLAAGFLRSRFWIFCAHLLFAAALWTPLLVGGTAVLGETVVRSVVKTNNLVGFVALVAAVVALRKLLRPLLTFAGRRRWVGFWKRKFLWEFWPVWAAYLPLAPYFVWLAIRHRSATLFTAANPGIPSGGLIGESKSVILGHLSAAEGFVPEFALIRSSKAPGARVRAAQAFMDQQSLSYPVVLKPDVGERGAGVKVIRSEFELQAYLREAPGDTILQRYVGGIECGIFYYRYPHEERGRIFSITEKRFPCVIGNGRSTLRELILRDGRAVCMASAYEKQCRRPMADVPAHGESVRLAELGTHCRGAIFVDGRDLWAQQLEDAVDRVSQAHPGFFIGRFDVRASSREELMRGRFRVLELNGVSAEAAHIYDPKVSVWEAYRVLGRQWRMAFEIGAMNRARGARPMTIYALWKTVSNSRRCKISAPAEQANTISASVNSSP